MMRSVAPSYALVRLPETMLNMPLSPIKGMEVGLIFLTAYTAVYTVSLAPACRVRGTSTFCTAYWLKGNTSLPIAEDAEPPRKSST